MNMLFINKKKMKAFFSSKDVFIFLFFLLLSFFFWYLLNLRRVYEVTLPVTLTYINVSIDKINETSLPRDIQITVKDQGFYLLSYKTNKLNPIVIDLRRNATEDNKTFYIPYTLLRSKIKEELRHSTEILRIQPEEITIPIVKKAYKTLPITFAGTITFARQYNLSGNINIVPSEIKVFGEKAVLDTMQTIYTEAINFKNLKDTVNRDIALQSIAGLKYSVEKVNIHIPVDKFTEKTVEIPITSKNLPKNMEIRFFPSSVSATFFITFSKFNSVSSNNFEAIIDYNHILKNKSERQKPEIKTNNPFIFNIRTSPAEVEYLIEMKKWRLTKNKTK